MLEQVSVRSGIPLPHPWLAIDRCDALSRHGYVDGLVILVPPNADRERHALVGLLLVVRRHGFLLGLSPNG
jgi:hypothetical protein